MSISFSYEDFSSWMRPGISGGFKQRDMVWLHLQQDTLAAVRIGGKGGSRETTYDSYEASGY